MKHIQKCEICHREFYATDKQAEICGTACLGKYKEEHGVRWKDRNMAVLK